MAFVQQNPEDQFCTLTVQDEIAFGLENLCMDPIAIEERIDKSLAVVQGKPLKGRELNSLSGGEKQKIAIASMLALNPDVLILDEPTSNLDPQATQNIFKTLFNLRHLEEMTVIIIEHKLDQLMELDPIIFSMEEGKLTQGLRPSKPDGDQKRQVNISLFSPDKIQAPDTHSPIVQMNNITIAIEGHEILQNFNLNIFPAQFIALMGPNGSGKTTLLQSIMGLHQITHGTCTLFDHQASSTTTSELVSDIGYVFQNPDHQLFMPSVWEEITFTAKNLGLLGSNYKQTAREWTNQIGLANRFEDHPQRLSFGEKRRVNVVASLLHSPRLLLIDELLIGQDSHNARHWMAFLKAFSELGFSIILSIHHPQLILDYCNRVIFLDEGRILFDGGTSNAFDCLSELGFHAFLPKDKRKAINV